MLALLLVGAFIFPQHSLAAEPLRKVYKKDVDGDRKAERLVYEIRELKNYYEGSLIITSAGGQVLWEHRWGMDKDDLKELIETEGNVTKQKLNLESWVAKFFAGGLNYGADIETGKLKSSDLSEEQLAVGAKYYGVSVASIRKSILSQKSNRLLSYRAEWREDLLLLVYVPSIKKFLCYQRGY